MDNLPDDIWLVLCLYLPRCVMASQLLMHSVLSETLGFDALGFRRFHF